MEKILNDLLDVSRLEYGKFNLECEHLDLREVIRSSVDDFRDRAAGKGLTLNVACSNDPLLVFADPTRLSQVFDNLLRNSVSFTDRGGSIVVGCERRERAAHVTVRDTGIGLSPEVASTMYEPFHQAPQEIDRSRGGLGLGLSIVKSLIALHGGTIQATSPGPGQGTTMIVTLPLKEPSPQSQVGSSPTPVQPRQILLIEDDADAAKMLSCLLEMDGHTVIHAETGELGLALVEHKQPDVLLCDIGLPGTMNGFDVARALRNRGVEIPRIAITGYGQPEVRTKGKEAGFHEVLIKPIDLETLGALLCMHPSSEISKREKSGHTASDKHLPRHDGGTTG
jgi:CheY-like chemotaxis protein